MALDEDLVELLSTCFSDKELQESCFSWVVDHRRETTGRFRDVLTSNSLADFIKSLPTRADDLLRLPGLLQLKNAEAFAYIFALERAYSALEMNISDEPHVIFLDTEEIIRWARGMGLRSGDFDTFVAHVAAYRSYFRDLALRGLKRYQIVLKKQTFHRFLMTKTVAVARSIIEDMIFVITTAPRFELVLLDVPDSTDEFEVISAHPQIPSSLDSTVSLVIRRTSMAADKVEYALVPMPPTFSGLQRDISKVNQYWSLALDQYRAARPVGFWLNPNRLTVSLLAELIDELS
jgi:hypothetical protein